MPPSLISCVLLLGDDNKRIQRKNLCNHIGDVIAQILMEILGRWITKTGFYSVRNVPLCWLERILDSWIGVDIDSNLDWSAKIVSKATINDTKEHFSKSREAPRNQIARTICSHTPYASNRYMLTKRIRNKSSPVQCVQFWKSNAWIDRRMNARKVWDWSDHNWRLSKADSSMKLTQHNSVMKILIIICEIGFQPWNGHIFSSTVIIRTDCKYRRRLARWKDGIRNESWNLEFLTRIEHSLLPLSG